MKTQNWNVGAMVQANAAFIADAFNVAHETGLTPRQLADSLNQREEQIHGERATTDKLLAQRNELAKALRAVVSQEFSIDADFNRTPHRLTQRAELWALIDRSEGRAS